MKEPRKIYVDGQLIGEVPTTDDNQKDMEAAIALMREKGVYRETTCACRKLNPAILVMQSAQDWATKNVPGAIDGARDRRIFLQG
jgi:hypothetical protein